MLFLIGPDVNIFWCKLALLNVSVQVTPAQHQIGLQRLLLLSSAVARHHAARGTALGRGRSLCALTCISGHSGYGRGLQPACLCTRSQLGCVDNLWVPVPSLRCARETHDLNQVTTNSLASSWAALNQPAVVALDHQNFVPSRLDAPRPFASPEAPSVSVMCQF